MLFASLLLAIAGIVFTFCITWGMNQERLDATASTDVFQKFSLNTLDGKKISAKDTASSRYIAYNIWGTDCPPCIQELPDLEELNNSYDPADFRVIGIPLDVTNHGEEIIDVRLEEAKKELSRHRESLLQT